MELRQLGNSDLRVSAIALGTWPMAGMTSLNVNDTDSLATITAALDSGVNFFDTAYCYGAHGECDLLLGKALAGKRDKAVLAAKGGVHWAPSGERVDDAHPATLRRECEGSLQRLNTDRVDLLYLHSPDRTTPVAESAGELKRLMDEGKTRTVGASNCTFEQLKQFADACPLTAYQPRYNMLQREIEADILPWCRDRGISVCVYWPLMKGLLTGKFGRNHQFDPRDGRQKYAMYQGEEWQKNQDFLDELRAIAAEAERSVAQVVINWTIHQSGITVALCGAKRPTQIRDTAAAMKWKLSDAHLRRINQAIADRGKILSGKVS